MERCMNGCLLPVARDTFVSSHISFPCEEDFVRATGLQKSACANDTIYCTKTQYQYHMEKNGWNIFAYIWEIDYTTKGREQSFVDERDMSHMV